MKRHRRAGLAALGIAFALAAADASAQTPNQPPPSSPPPQTPTPPPAAAAPIGPAAPLAAGSAVRMHLTTEKNKGVAHLYIHRANDTWTSLCDSPCTADVPVNAELRVTLGNNDDDPHTFALSGDLGPEVDVIVKPASSGPLIGGIVLMGAGGAFVLSGLLFVALGSLETTTSNDLGGTSNSAGSTTKSVGDAYKITGYVCIGLGAAAAVAGLVLLLARTHEPRTFDSPHHGDDPRLHGREGTLLGDVAAVSRTGPTPLSPALAPLTYGFSF